MVWQAPWCDQKNFKKEREREEKETEGPGGPQGIHGDGTIGMFESEPRLCQIYLQASESPLGKQDSEGFREQSLVCQIQVPGQAFPLS